MMTPLEHFEKRVKEHTLQLHLRSKDTALIWDLWCALQELTKEHDTLHKSTFADCVPGPRKHREPVPVADIEGGEIVDGPKAATRKLVPLAPGEPKPSYALDNVPDGFRLETDDEFRKRILATPIPHNPVREVTSLEQAKKEFGPEPVPDWLVWAVDKLREDYKDGNFYRSEAAAKDLLIAIDEAGYAIVPKDPQP